MASPIPAKTVYLPLDPPAVVISSHFLAQYPVNLTVATKIRTFGGNDLTRASGNHWTALDLTVKDVSGTVIFTVKSKQMSLRNRRKLLDSAGNVLLSLRHKLMTAHARWVAYRGDSMDDDGDLLFTVRKSSIMQMSSKLDVFLAGNEEEDVPDFKIRGSFSEGSCVVYLGNTDKIIAQMYRGPSMATALVDKDDLRVTIYPNVDYSFIVSLVVILEKIDADGSGKESNAQGLGDAVNSISSMLQQ